MYMYSVVYFCMGILHHVNLTQTHPHTPTPPHIHTPTHSVTHTPYPNTQNRGLMRTR